MITINGIELKKVTNINFGSETGFIPIIYFIADDRVEGCIELEDFEELNPQCFQKPMSDELGVYRIILPKEADLKFEF